MRSWRQPYGKGGPGYGPKIVRPPAANKRVSQSHPTRRCPRTARFPAGAPAGGNPTASQSLVDDPDCVQLRDQLYENDDFSKVETARLQHLCRHLREFANQNALSQDYTNAIKATTLLNHVRDELFRRHGADSSQNAQSDQTALDDFEACWQDKLANFDSETSAKREKLVAQQTKVDEDFERYWGEEMPRRYRKPSVRYLQLKEQERALAISGNFEAADQLHKENDQLLQEESEVAQQNLNSDYKQARAKFTERQQQELEQYDKQRKDTRVTLQNRYHREKSVFDQHRTVHRADGARNSRFQNIGLDLGAPVGSTIEAKAAPRDLLLLPLTAPNDPSVLDSDRKRVEEQKRRSQQFLKWNAQRALSRYTGESVGPPPEASGHVAPIAPRPVHSPFPETESEAGAELVEIVAASGTDRGAEEEGETRAQADLPA